MPASLLGFWVSGDLAGLTIYTTRKGNKVWYNEAPANKAPTTLQTTQRNRFAASQANWSSQSKTTKKAWERLTNAAHLCMTGQNLWIKVSLSGQLGILHTLVRQTGITVADPPLH